LKQETIGEYYKLYNIEPTEWPFEFTVHWELASDDVTFFFEEEADWVTFLTFPLTFIASSCGDMDLEDGEVIVVKSLINKRQN
jgi:hypothetical protein